jgi:uncharacterized protein YcbK (DUF882 family)
MKLSPHFHREEFQCQGAECEDALDPVVDHGLIEVLEDVRTHFNKSITVTSGYRCPVHNEHVGGRPNSQHLQGRAADIIVRSRSPEEVVEYLESKYPDTLGIGLYGTFTHVDSRTKRGRW